MLKNHSWIFMLGLIWPIAQAATECASVSEIPTTECDALVALYNSTDGANWSDNTDWNVTDTPCSWFGVGCEDGHVIGLWLSDNQLSGPIPTELENLSNLRELGLSNNQLSDSIPTELENLTHLEYLDLSDNQFEDFIPVGLGNLSRLRSLYLSSNKLKGSIPDELGNLSHLRYLDLSSNKLEDSIPATLGNLTNLWDLDLSNNKLSGPIPTELGDLVNLIWGLNLSDNQLSSSIPSELGNLTYLGYLWLNDNELCGNVPVSFMDLEALFELSIDNNHLSAFNQELIDWLDEYNPGWDTTQTPCTEPSVLAFSSNAYSIAEEGREITIIVKRTNSTTGEVCVDYTTNNETAIDGSDYEGTSDTLCWDYGDDADKTFTVVIIDDEEPEDDETFTVSLSNPSDGAELGELNTARVTIRNIDRAPFKCENVTEIPLLECKALVKLYDSTDGDHWKDRTGWKETNTPCSWKGIDNNCKNGHVTRLYLQYNQLNGSLPEELGNLKELTVVNMANNDLSGPIPTELIQLSKLWSLNLENNQFSGSIPTFNCDSQLEYLLLKNNELCGEVPISLMCLDLSKLSLDNNHLTASDPDLADWIEGLNPGWGNSQTVCPVSITLLFSSDSYSITEDGGQITVIVKRIGASAGAVSVDYVTSDDAAIAGEDYVATSGALHWDDGDAADKTFLVDIINDSDPESDETFSVNLDNPTGGAVLGPPSTAMVAIMDDDPPIFDCAIVTEIPSTECEALVALYNSTDGDYWSNNTNWNMMDTPCGWYGVSCQNNRVTGLDLSSNELGGSLPDKFFELKGLKILNLSDNLLNGYISDQFSELNKLKTLRLNDNELCGVISVKLMELEKLVTLSLDNNHLTASDSDLLAWIEALNPGWQDSQTVCPVSSTLLFSSDSYSVTEDEGQAIFIVQRIGVSAGAVSVDYATSDDTAIAGEDYVVTSGTLHWDDDDAADKTFLVDITNDSDPESDETFSVSLGNPTGGAVLGSPNTAMVTIMDDDPPIFDCAMVTEIPSTECEALVALYNSTDGDYWSNNTNWNMTDTPCGWHGVSCQNSRVTGLDLSSNELCGEISVKLMKLKKLVTLRLDNNHLTASDSDLIDWIEALNPGWQNSQTPCS
jgi:Leucine-rich repeat (LRR) protein